MSTSPRYPETRDEQARAIHHDVQLVRDRLGPVTEENLGEHAILAHIGASVLNLGDDASMRELIYKSEIPLMVTGWSLDYWPEYPDWVFDD